MRRRERRHTAKCRRPCRARRHPPRGRALFEGRRSQPGIQYGKRGAAERALRPDGPPHPQGGRSPLGERAAPSMLGRAAEGAYTLKEQEFPAMNDRGRRTVLRRQSSAPSCRSHVSVEQPVDAMRARFQPQRPERPDHGVARQSRSATIPAARPFFATIQKPSRKMTSSTSGRSCPGRTAKCVGSERTRSYCARVICIRSAQSRLAHSQTNSKTSVSEPCLSASASIWSFISRNHASFMANRSARSPTPVQLAGAPRRCGKWSCAASSWWKG